MDEKKTFGQEVAEVQTKNAGKFTQTIRETTNEMARDWKQSLEKVIEDHKHLREPYYIMEIIQMDQFIPGLLRLKHMARKSRPLPEPGITLYKVDNVGGSISLEWVLPHEGECDLVMANPGGWDKKLVDDIMAYRSGTLV